MKTAINAADFVAVLAAALTHASKDATHRLASVFIHKKGNECAMVASDGHRLIEISRKWQIDADLIIARDDAQRVLALVGKKATGEITLDTATRQITCGDNVVKMRECNTIYPDYEQVIRMRTDAQAAKIGVNAEYLADAQAAFTLLCDSYKRKQGKNQRKPNTHVHMHFAGDLDPMIITPDGTDQSVRVVVMPVRM